jgi:hypothetical protein
MPQTTNPPAVKPRYDVADISIALFSGVVLAVTALFLCTVPLAGKMAGSRDFVAYYATGRQLVHHADPYDADAIRRIERSAGLSVDGVLLMRNPPWGLPLAYPLGFFGVRIAAILWSLVLLACLLIPVHLIRKLHGSPPNHIHWLSLSFAPALMCLTMGQTSLFALLGLTLFLYYHLSRPFAAGASLWLCALKPHLFLPFAAVLLAWILFSRSYKVLAGAVAAMAASCALTFCIDPSAFSAYLALMRSPSVVQEFVPCLSDAFRFSINQRAVWLQYLPAAVGAAWALWFYWRRRREWNWIENGNLLILVSLVAAPYSFLYDQAIAVPAVMHAAFTTRRRSLLVVAVCLLAIIEVQALRVRISSVYYLWTAPAWLFWYLIARSSAAAHATSGQVEPAHNPGAEASVPATHFSRL